MTHPCCASLPTPILTTASVALPCLLVAGINGKMRWDAHWEHVAHGPPKEEKPEYAYQNIRTKNFFWGDGDKVSTVPMRSHSQLSSRPDPVLERQGQLPQEG